MKQYQQSLLVLLFLIFSYNTFSQYTLSGKVTNTALQPLRYVSITIKELKLSTQTNAEGFFNFSIDEGKYDLVATMSGYKPQLITLVVNGKNIIQNIILEENKIAGEDAQVIAIRKDRWNEIMRNVIRNKENYLNATSTYSCNVYIKATQENEKTVFKKRKDNTDSLPIVALNDKITNMSMAEIVLKLDKTIPDKIKETRTGVKIRGNADNLFYLRTTDGEFSIYQNLIKVPALTNIPMLSPVSNAGLGAYKFKTTRLRKRDGRKFYTISFKPVNAGNALIEGEIEIMDSLWVITSASYNFPNYLLEQYDYFGVEQTYDSIETGMFLLNRQDLTYVSKLGKNVATGKTLSVYNKYDIDPKFSKKYFGNELSSTTQEAYEQDSVFWDQVRQEPLSTEQFAFIKYTDSVSRAHSTQAYMDSVDNVFNKITLSKLFFNGQGFYSRKKDRSIFIGPFIGIVQPLQFAGTRLEFNWDYHKTYSSRKQETIWGNVNYGFKNNDFKGEVKLRKLYNPFSKAAYELNISRGFHSLYNNGSWQDQLKRSGIYEKDDFGGQHEIELLNGLYFTNRVDYSFRRSAQRYKLNTDSLDLVWGLFKIRPSDTPIVFPAYQGLFNTIAFSYTPQQKYIREPREKIVLGSKWPTFSIMWRKGIPSLLGSSVDYDYVEYKVAQQMNLNLFGILNYNFTTGKYYNRKSLREPDYKFIRQGDKFVFLKPTNTFQNMSNSFPVFDRFYEFHLVHNFNGNIINRIPFMKKLKLQELAGFGMFYSKEVNLTYYEGFFGLEKIAKLFKDRYKIGCYGVFSNSNQSTSAFNLKLSFEKFNRRRAGWY
jgi:hypothetical protein